MSLTPPSRLSRYLTVILRWLLITFVVFFLTILSGVYITDNLLSKVYTATARIQLRQLVVMGPGTWDKSIDPTYLQGEFATLESANVLLPVINDLDLDEAWAGRVYKSRQELLPPAEALAYLRKILRIDVVPGTNIINITASSDVPKEAADIANAVADRYKTLRDAEEDQRNVGAEDDLREQVGQQQTVVDEKKSELGKLSNNQSPVYLAARRDLEQQQALLDALNVRLKYAEAYDPLLESPIRIVSRAEAPLEPSQPNKALSLIVTLLVAGFLSVLAASFVEMIFLFSRASERMGN